jgi:hypothetical protein
LFLEHLSSSSTSSPPLITTTIAYGGLYCPDNCIHFSHTNITHHFYLFCPRLI